MKGLIDGNENLQKDLGAYMTAKMKGDDSIFNSYVDNNYDSSADYWKVIVKEDGSYKMEYDNSDDITVTNENGDELASFKYQGGSKTGFIAETLGLDKNTVNEVMGTQYGWTFENNEWVNDGKTDGIIRFGNEISQRILFPLDTNQRSFVEDILGQSYKEQAFNYDSVRISYTTAPEKVLRELTNNSTIASTLALYNMKPPDIETLITNTTGDTGHALSLPGGSIYFPVKLYTATDESDKNKTLALLTHEVFHQFQYMNMGAVNGFSQLLGESILRTQYDNHIPGGVNVYDYIINNNAPSGIITQWSDLIYMEGQARFIQDFAISHANRTAPPHTRMTVGGYARVLGGLRLSSAAIRSESVRP
jgi:hypothetical protein